LLEATTLLTAFEHSLQPLDGNGSRELTPIVRSRKQYILFPFL